MSTSSSSLRPADEAARLLEIVDRFHEPRVLVIGDFIADEFIYGRVARISREAPVLILEYDRTQVVPGGAGNAASNVAALGARTRAVGLVGDDDIGRRMIEGLHENIERTGVIARPGESTPTKTRILAGGVHSAKQQVVRIDRITRVKADAQARELFRREVLRAAPRYDAVLVSDYGAGLVTPSLVAEVKKAVAKPAASRDGRAARADPDRFALRSRALSRAHRVHAERSGSGSGARHLDSRQHRGARARGARAAREDEESGRADHARQPRDGAVRARSADAPSGDLRVG